MKITVEQQVAEDLVAVFYDLYVTAFDPLRTLAAARHVLTLDEFSQEMTDSRIDKYVVWDNEARPVGLTTLTTDLSAVPWISEDFYATRFPEQTARRAVFYLGYTLVHPDHESEGMTARIIAKIAQRMHFAGGVCAFDVGGYNDATHGIGAKIAGIGRWRPMDFDTVDSQTYYAAVFHGPDAPRVPRPRAGEPATEPTGTAETVSPSAPAGGGRATKLAQRGVTRTVPLAERLDLAAAVPEILASRWPMFMLLGQSGHDVDLPQLLAAHPAHQILLLDEADEVLGVGLSLPLTWDGTVDGLPSGWDGAVTASADLLRTGGEPNCVSAVSVTLTPQAAGGGHAVGILRAMKEAALQAGAAGMIAPVRPIWKSRYPLIPLDQYVSWRTPDGQMFDPWLRVHLGLGARMLSIAERSLTVTGSIEDWQTWTDLTLPGSGSYPIAGGNVPLEVDTATDQGTYCEPNVWMLHSRS